MDVRKLSFKNEHSMGVGSTVGCFHCVCILTQEEIGSLGYIEEGHGHSRTARCPRCDKTSLINFRMVLAEIGEEEFGNDSIPKPDRDDCPKCWADGKKGLMKGVFISCTHPGIVDAECVRGHKFSYRLRMVQIAKAV